MSADFTKDLKKGKKAELDFLAACGKSIVASDGFKGDFVAVKSGEKLELKTDFYAHDLTKNFFMERYSYDEKNGGPWQAADHGCKYFVYYFKNPGFIYVFETKKLVDLLNNLTKSMGYVNVYNQGYTTRGYKIARDLLKQIEVPQNEWPFKFDGAKYGSTK